ncbi:MAG: EF-hand domain-containing protein [Candidatus Omnitrophica bacterium]|nr:EF-hand domain-containing protein [Candidatus Omnitrophota bacterium]
MSNLVKAMFSFVLVISFYSINLFAEEPVVDLKKLEFQKIDTDKNGYIEKGEMDKYEEQSFNEIDKDKNGYITPEELLGDKTYVFGSAEDTDKDAKISKTESASRFSEYFKQMDKDNDNRVNEQEYTDYWKGIYRF